MPRKELPRVQLTPRRDELLAKLVEEWDHPQAIGEPVILTQKARTGEMSRIFVIWSEWGDLTQPERSELIMDACEKVLGEEASLNVLIAMGLTPEEADRMHIAYK